MLDIGASEKEARIAYGIANVSVGFTAAGLLKHSRELKKTGELVGKGTLIDEVVDDTGIPPKNQIEKPAGSPAVDVSEGGKETELFFSDEYYKKIDENIAKAIEARDAEVTRIQGLSKTQQSKIVTVVGGVDIRTGEVHVGVKNSKIYAGNASCAEDIVFRGLGGNTNANIIMTPAVRPRTGEIIPVCTRCQTKYPVNQFVKGTTFQ